MASYRLPRHSCASPVFQLLMSLMTAWRLFDELAIQWFTRISSFLFTNWCTSTHFALAIKVVLCGNLNIPCRFWSIPTKSLSLITTVQHHRLQGWHRPVENLLLLLFFFFNFHSGRNSKYLSCDFVGRNPKNPQSVNKNQHEISLQYYCTLWTPNKKPNPHTHCRLYPPRKTSSRARQMLSLMMDPCYFINNKKPSGFSTNQIKKCLPFGAILCLRNLSLGGIKKPSFEGPRILKSCPHLHSLPNNKFTLWSFYFEWTQFSIIEGCFQPFQTPNQVSIRFVSTLFLFLKSLT